MTRKDYEAIAHEFNAQMKALRVFLDHNSEDQLVTAQAVALEGMAGQLCRVFKQDNARFDAQRFMKACCFEG